MNVVCESSGWATRVYIFVLFSEPHRMADNEAKAAALVAEAKKKMTSSKGTKPYHVL